MSKRNPVLDAIFARRSIRRYKEEKVADADLQAILKAAVSAPSAANLQNYSIIVVKDPAKKDVLFELSGGQKYVKSCDALLVFVVDAYRHKRWCEYRDADFHHDTFFTVLWGMTDAIAAAENAVIAAQGLGLGTVYIGTVLGRMREMIELLKLPECTYPAAMLCLGVPNESPEARGRFPMNCVVHEDEYHDYTDEQLEAVFADAEENFAGTAKVTDDAKNFAQYLTRKRFTAEKILGRSKSAMLALIDQGFWHEEHMNVQETVDDSH